MKRVLNEGKLLLVNKDFSPYFYWVAPYSEYGSGSKRLLNTVPQHWFNRNVVPESIRDLTAQHRNLFTGMKSATPLSSSAIYLPV